MVATRTRNEVLPAVSVTWLLPTLDQVMPPFSLHWYVLASKSPVVVSTFDSARSMAALVANGSDRLTEKVAREPSSTFMPEMLRLGRGLTPLSVIVTVAVDVPPRPSDRV